MRERGIYPQDCPRTVRSRRNRCGNTELACSPKYHGAKTAYWAGWSGKPYLTGLWKVSPLSARHPADSCLHNCQRNPPDFANCISPNRELPPNNPPQQTCLCPPLHPRKVGTSDLRYSYKSLGANANGGSPTAQRKTLLVITGLTSLLMCVTAAAQQASFQELDHYIANAM